MKIHILAIKFPDGKLSVKTYPSRKEMVSKKTEFSKVAIACYMLPPVNIERSVEGVLKAAGLINAIHTLGPTKVMEEMEKEESYCEAYSK